MCNLFTNEANRIRHNRSLLDAKIQRLRQGRRSQTALFRRHRSNRHNL